MPNQWIYSTALAYKTDPWGSAVIGEIYGSFPTEQFTIPTDRQLSNMEMILGYRWRPFQNLDIHGGVGTELYHGLGSPDFRAFLGLNFRLNSPDDKAGPTRVVQPVPEAANPTRTGLPDADSDGDGVPDMYDRCPDTPAGARVNSFGCEIKPFEP